MNAGLTQGLLIVAASTMLASCGGSPEQQTAGIDGSGVHVVAEGPIEAFGSIVVGGQHYGLSEAVVRINGEVAVESDLALGQVVVVEATRELAGSLRADTVAVESLLRGAVESVDTGTGQLVVLSQDVRTTAETVFAPGPGLQLADIAVGDYVEISGFSGGDGRIIATRVARAEPADGLRIVGEVEHLNAGTLTFEINGLVVDFSSAGLVDGFPGGGPADDDEVLVIGTALNGSGALVATRLMLLASGFAGNEGHEAEVEGLITRFVSPADFDVAGVAATTTNQTDYEGGDAADLQLNVKVQVEGRIGSGGAIVARKVEVKDGGRVY
jgi:hypothetical protein